MIRLLVLALPLALSLLFDVRPLSAQSLDEKARITLWFARLIVDSTVPRRPVIFVLPTGAPDKPGLDSLRQLLSPAFQHAGLSTTPEEREPGRDTLLVTIGAPSTESHASNGTLYTLFYTRRYRTPECIRNEIYAVRLRCTVQRCHFFSESPVGAEPFECRRRP